MSETNKHNTLYLFDGSWPFTVITRNPDGKLHFSGSDDMPENIDDDMGDPGFYVFDGTVFDAEGWTPEQCAAAGISSEAARYSEWWHGSMKPATLADVAHVFALATPPRPAAREDDAMMQVLEERDRYHEAADNLAAHIVEITVGGDVVAAIGEHSNCNDPWENALELYPPAVRVLDGWYLVEHNRHVYEQLNEASARQAFADLAAKDPSIPERMAVTRLALLDAAPDESVCEECGGRGGYEVSLDPPMSLPCACTLDAAPDAGTGEGATGKAALQVDDAAVGSVVVDEAMAGMATGKAGSLRETQPEIHETLVQTVHAYMEVARIGVQQNKYGDTFLRRHTSALKTARSVQDALEALILALPAAAQPTEGAGDASL